MLGLTFICCLLLLSFNEGGFIISNPLTSIFDQLYRPNPLRTNEVINLSDETSRKTFGESLVINLTVIITSIIHAMLNNCFDYEHFPFEKQQNSGLTKKAGLYAVLNKKTKKLYIGCTTNLAQRKGDHYRNLNDPDSRREKLSPAFLAERETSEITDFYFVPLLVIENPEQLEVNNQRLLKFLENYVENILLEDFLNRPPEKLFGFSPTDVFLNVTAVGRFVTQVKTARSPESGEASSPISYENYAWESKSAAGHWFGVARKLINSKIAKGTIFELTKEEYERFTGTKISNDKARLISKVSLTGKDAQLNADPQQAEDRERFTVQLFPTVAKKRYPNSTYRE